jgi:hypothetical protein
MTELRFAGDWSWGIVFALALALAGIAFVIYGRELKKNAGLGPAMKKVLPLLRSAAIFLLVLMLAGPVLHHTHRIGELARLIIIADASQSMNLRDPDLDTGRKLLIAKRLGWLDSAALDDSSARAADAMMRVGDLTQTAASAADSSLKAIALEAASAQKAVSQDATVSGRIKSEILDPAETLKKNLATAKPPETKEGLSKIGQSAEAIERILRASFAMQASATNDPRIKAAIDRFNGISRWQRVQELLFDGENSVMKRLSASHDVEIKLLRPGKIENVWASRAGRHEGNNEMPLAFSGVADGKITDLNLALTAADDADHPELATGAVSRTTAIVLLSDGKHNAGESPVQRSKMLGSRGVHVFTVGMGGTNRPGDLAVAGVVNPKSVFVKDRVRGAIRLKDDMPSGRSFTLRITSGAETLWEQELTSQGIGVRMVDYDFPVEKMAEKMQRDGDKTVAHTTLPVEAMVSVSDIEGDREQKNNSLPMRFSVSLQKHRMLMIEGRSRWDWRYIRNMFARDEQWDVTSVLADNGELPRGKPTDSMPESREAMFGYDLIFLGEVSARMMRSNELQWIADFVGDRAGGLIMMDGQRKELRTLPGTPLGPLLPVEWLDGDAPEAKSLQLTKAGESFDALNLSAFGVSASAGPGKGGTPNSWPALAAPKWMAHVRTLPGAELLAEAVTASTNLPALVFRRFGAGKVFYTAFDESWRWRVPEPEQFHQRYWRQLALAIMEAPFAVRDPRVSLDTDSMTYRPGQQAEIRARLRDERGKPLAKGEAYALLAHDGQVVASVPLTADETGGGLFRAKTGALAEGDYEVRVAIDGVADSEIKARASFRVAPADIGELTDLGCDEPLMRQLAANASGGYFREENLDDVVARIAPLSSGQIIESETALWQSYWWFSAVLGLLTAEWLLRKRAGLL